MIANLITFSRIILSLTILFCSPLSVPFYVLYCMAGFTDMIDGTVARKMGTDGEFGARLDTAADFIFVMICLFRLIPVLQIETWMTICIIIIALIKTANQVSSFVIQKKPAAVHSVMNKLTGAMLFALPLTLQFIDLRYSAALVCVIAAAAAIQEGHLIRAGQMLGSR